MLGLTLLPFASSGVLADGALDGALARYVARAAMRCMEAADDYERSEDSRKVHLRWGVALDAEAAQLCDKYTGYPTKKGGPNDSDL